MNHREKSELPYNIRNYIRDPNFEIENPRRKREKKRGPYKRPKVHPLKQEYLHPAKLMSPYDSLYQPVYPQSMYYNGSFHPSMKEENKIDTNDLEIETDSVTVSTQNLDGDQTYRKRRGRRPNYELHEKGMIKKESNHSNMPIFNVKKQDQQDNSAFEGSKNHSSKNNRYSYMPTLDQRPSDFRNFTDVEYDRNHAPQKRLVKIKEKVDDISRKSIQY